MIAALYVQKGGAYFGLEGVDPWDEARDARRYVGPHAVVAHPPCARWCRLAGLVQSRYPHLRKGEDGGCFAAALRIVRAVGGVLEHPAFSDAWPAFGLARPAKEGGWSAPDRWGGRACQVDQGNYGHAARKSTWLYAVGIDFPQLRGGASGADSMGRLRRQSQSHARERAPLGHRCRRRARSPSADEEERQRDAARVQGSADRHGEERSRLTRGAPRATLGRP